MNANLKPLNNRVVIAPEESDKESKGGIVIPDSSQDKPSKGKVLSVGDGVMLENGERAKMSVAEGDMVIFSKYSGTEVELDNSTVLILKEDDILAVC